MRRAYIVTLLVSALVVTTAGSNRPTDSRGETLHRTHLRSEATAPVGSVILVNNAWNRVTVEVRIGKYDDVNQNRVYDTKTIGKGKWSIPCASDEGYVWWRRDTDPDHPNGQMTVWTKKACFGKDEEVSL